MPEQLPAAVVIRLSAWGDILLTADFTHHLSRSHRVLFVTGPAYQQIASHLPGVEEVLCLRKDATAEEKKHIINQLNQTQPAWVFDLQNKMRTVLFRRQIRAQRCVALSKRTWLQGLMALLGSDTVLDREHQSRPYLSILDSSSTNESVSPQLQSLPQLWQDRANTYINDNVTKNEKPIVGLAFGATHPTKGWPIAHLCNLIEMLENHINWVLVGGPGDQDRVQKIESILGKKTPSDTCDQSLEGLTGIISQMNCLIGVDTGPIHMARLLNVPTLTLFGPTSIKRWGPGSFSSPQHRTVSLELPCQPCSNHGDTLCPLEHHACMKDLQPELVAEELRSILGESF